MGTVHSQATRPHPGSGGLERASGLLQPGTPLPPSTGPEELPHATEASRAPTRPRLQVGPRLTADVKQLTFIQPQRVLLSLNGSRA